MLRVMIFIDGSTLEESLLSVCGRQDVDLAKFCGLLCGPERHLVRSLYYYPFSNPYLVDQRTTKYRYEQRFREYLRDAPNLEEGAGTKFSIVIDLIKHAAMRNYDVAILVSQNEDYAYTLQAVKDFGRNVEVALFGEPTALQGLRDVADRVIPMNRRYFDGLWLEG